jgi:hypothetical protein
MSRASRCCNWLICHPSLRRRLSWVASGSRVAYSQRLAPRSKCSRHRGVVASIAVRVLGAQEKAPAAAYGALARFKEHNWKALNSYTRAGIQPLRRHADGYPEALLSAVLCNANGLGAMSCMQAVALSGARNPIGSPELAHAQRDAALHEL